MESTPSELRRPPLRIDVLTLFPDMFSGFLNESILKIAQQKGLVEIVLCNIRDYATDKHGTVDDRPYGGGPGMVMKCEPVFAAVEDMTSKDPRPPRLIALTPQGEVFRHALAAEYAAEQRLMLLCGRYEGFDERIVLGLKAERLSIGDYVLSGGEVAAMAVIEAVARLVPGVLGDKMSAVQDSFTSGLLDYPQYTRPEEFRGMRVPDVLLSGHHAEIEKWRRQQAEILTRRLRPDLLAKNNKDYPKPQTEE